MLTEHANLRLRQRGIPPLIKIWLIDYGKCNYDGHGVMIRYFNKDSIRRMKRAFGKEPIRSK